MKNFKKLLITFILLYNMPSHSGFLDGLLEGCYFSFDSDTFCNCGVPDKEGEKYITLDNYDYENDDSLNDPISNLSRVIRQGNYKKNIGKNCIPYQRHSHLDGCLRHQTFISPLHLTSSDATYKRQCVEALPEQENSFFEPKLRMRFKACFGGCWTRKADLKHGECIIYPGPIVGWPERYCARIAQPPVEADNNNEAREADHGWKPYGVNQYGLPNPVDEDISQFDDDGRFKADNGSYLVKRDAPDRRLARLCLYNDPFVGSDPGDLIDNIPDEQPLHHTPGETDETKKFVKLLNALVDENASEATMASSLSGYDSLGNYSLKLLKFLGYNTFKGIIKWFTRPNAIVTEAFDCVDLPLGPMPPPFCDYYQNKISLPSLESICMDYYKPGYHENAQTSIYLLGNSHHSCVTSPEYDNNFIHNSVRVGFNNFMRKCDKTKNEVPSEHICVDLYPEDLSSDIIHNNFDLLEKCNASKSNTPCVDVNCSDLNCPTKFRILYDVIENGRTSVKQRNWMQTDSNSYLKFAGVNTGEWADLYYDLSHSTPNNSAEVKSPFSHDSKSYIVAIDRINENEICVSKKDSANNKTSNVGCVARSPKPLRSITKDNCTNEFLLENCADNNDLAECNYTHYTTGRDASLPAIPDDILKNDGHYAGIASTHMRPQAVAKMCIKSRKNSSKNYVLRKVLNTVNIDNLLKTDLGNEDIDFYGINLRTYVTDYSFDKVPFDSSNSRVSNSGMNIDGDYKDINNYPIDLSDSNKKYVYISGLDYKNGKYIAGGKFICVNNYELPACEISYNLTHDENNRFITPKYCVKTKKIPESVPIANRTPSMKLIDRETPPYSNPGNNLPVLSMTGNDYYDLNNRYQIAADNTRTDTLNVEHAIRPKTEVEMGWCIEVPEPPTCGNSNQGRGGNFTGEAAFGDVVNGSCHIFNAKTIHNVNYVPMTCVLNSNDSASFAITDLRDYCWMLAEFQHTNPQFTTFDSADTNYNLYKDYLPNKTTFSLHNTYTTSRISAYSRVFHTKYRIYVNKDNSKFSIPLIVPKGAVVIKLDGKEIYGKEADPYNVLWRKDYYLETINPNVEMPPGENYNRPIGYPNGYTNHSEHRKANTHDLIINPVKDIPLSSGSHYLEVVGFSVYDLPNVFINVVDSNDVNTTSISDGGGVVNF